ncbi:MAG TPA: hypothetical protein VN203_26385, partial [Candidatus Acidoferrum sp.]|nr:hypothetical protein [Candidatus Acidoferrum sp.]
MLNLLWMIPTFCLAGFLVLATLGGRLSRRGISIVGVGSVALSTLAAFLVGASFLSSPPAGNAYTQVLWRWMIVSGLSPRIALYLDALSLVMIVVIT